MDTSCSGLAVYYYTSQKSIATRSRNHDFMWLVRCKIHDNTQPGNYFMDQVSKALQHEFVCVRSFKMNTRACAAGVLRRRLCELSIELFNELACFWNSRLVITVSALHSPDPAQRRAGHDTGSRGPAPNGAAFEPKFWKNKEFATNNLFRKATYFETTQAHAKSEHIDLYTCTPITARKSDQQQRQLERKRSQPQSCLPWRSGGARDCSGGHGEQRDSKSASLERAYTAGGPSYSVSTIRPNALHASVRRWRNPLPQNFKCFRNRLEERERRLNDSAPSSDVLNTR